MARGEFKEEDFIINKDKKELVKLEEEKIEENQENEETLKKVKDDLNNDDHCFKSDLKNSKKNQTLLF